MNFQWFHRLFSNNILSINLQDLGDYLVGDSLTESYTISGKDIQGNSVNKTVSANQSGWYKLSKAQLASIGIEKSSYEYIVNYEEGEVYNITEKTGRKSGDVLYIKLKD